jgi:Aminopeptidase P, N-terminal domain
MKWNRRSLACAAGLLLLAGPLTAAGPFDAKEYAARRARLMDRIGDGAAVFLGASTPASDQDFRQGHDFVYLTGVPASPGHIIKEGNEYIMFFSASMKRTLGIARTKDLNGPWTLDPQPIVPPEEQVENSSLYFEPSSTTCFLFTNHIGLEGFEYTDAVWVYWTKDLNKWDPAHKAVVLNGKNCSWSRKCIGLPRSSRSAIGSPCFTTLPAATARAT